MSEHDHQVATVEWFNLQYPKLRGLLFAIPNGGLRNKAVAGKLKAEGVRAGVSDLFLMVATKGMHGMWIEMKDSCGKRPSPEQIAFQKDAAAQGYVAVTCYGVDMAIGAISEYLHGIEVMET